MHTGTIARLLIDKGFGFIRDESGIEHFFHRSSVRGAVFELLREGQRVEFNVEESQKGPRAGDVRLVGAVVVGVVSVVLVIGAAVRSPAISSQAPMAITAAKSKKAMTFQPPSSVRVTRSQLLRGRGPPRSSVRGSTGGGGIRPSGLRSITNASLA